MVIHVHIYFSHPPKDQELVVLILYSMSILNTA